MKVLAKGGSPVNAEEYYHLSFQTKQEANDDVLRQQAKEMQEYAGALRRKLHDGQDVTEEKQALQQIREKYEAYYTQQMNELHHKQAAEYLSEGKVFDESRKEELLSKMAVGEEMTEQEKGLAGIFASAQEIDSATVSAKLQVNISKEIFRQMEQSGISPIPSFEVGIGIGGKAEVEGIEDAAVKEKVEDILSGFSGELMDTYISINASTQGMTKQEQYILKAAMGIETFLQKATGGNVALANITAENGRIKGLDAPFDKLLNDPGQNQTYEIDGVLYYDGALGDPVPVEKAFQCGCDKVVVILSKPKDVMRSPKKDNILADRIQKKYPLAAEQLKKRAEHYNQGVQLSKEYETQGRVLIVAPDDTCGVDTLTKNREALQRFYEKGYRDAQAIPEFFKSDI